eukprot:TRINITY_DN5661_c0_g3_i4.p1 TRINITY_DN5661_c0_g3~~TRINITY_DN5661_c0_g3_i4.p1  ORF type:complete len:399 (+),score=45.49 TRINITY_DN5661_c0_g3_i4:49-1245(+)
MAGVKSSIVGAAAENERDEEEVQLIPVQAADVEKVGHDVEKAEPRSTENKVSDAPPMPRCCGIEMKWVSLVLLTSWTTLGVIVIREVKRQPPKPTFSDVSVVFVSEMMKFTASFIMVAQSAGGFTAGVDVVKAHLMSNPWANLQVCLPSLLYAIQNNLQFLSLELLSTPIQQVTYQFKILTTAFFATTILGKSIGSAQWTSILILLAGLIFILCPREGSQADKSTMVGDGPLGLSSSTLMGFGAVAAACFTSGLAGVLLEKILKSTDASVWLRNVQLGLFSVAMTIVVAFLQDPQRIAEGRMFDGFDRRAFYMAGCQSVGGLLAAAVLKYADNVLRCFSVAISIILTALASWVTSDYSPDMLFLLGTCFVISACFLYSLGWPQRVQGVIDRWTTSCTA